MTLSDESSNSPCLPCPICRKPVFRDAKDAHDFPFCSRRCRTIDLGKWASGTYRIPVKPGEKDDEGGDSSSGEPGDR